jgi:helicase with SNF2 domain
LVCKDTVEEKILELHKNKEEMSELFNAINEKLTIEEIKQLFDY